MIIILSFFTTLFPPSLMARVQQFYIPEAGLWHYDTAAHFSVYNHQFLLHSEIEPEDTLHRPMAYTPERSKKIEDMARSQRAVSSCI